MIVTQAVCLVGGRGIRLSAPTDQLPKSMRPVGGKPFLDYIVDEACRFGLLKLLFLTGYRSEAIEARHAGKRFGQLEICTDRRHGERLFGGMGNTFQISLAY